MTAGEAHTEIVTTLKEWVNSYSDAMLSWAVYKTSNRQASEDLVQETFMAAFKSFDSFKQKSHPKTWLFSILNNKVTDYHRKNFRQQTFTESALRKEDKTSGINDLFDSHGKCSKDRVRRKLFLKICRLFPSEDKQKREILWQFLKKMTYAELAEHRHKVVEYCTRTARKI